MDEYRIFFRIKDEDNVKIEKINNNHLKHLSFKYGSYASVHTWNFNSQKDADEGKRIIQENCPGARNKF